MTEKGVAFSEDERLFLVNDVSYRVFEDGGTIELMWKWLNQVDGVRVYLFDANEPITAQALGRKSYFNVTKVEFQKRLGKYTLKTERTGLLKIVILPYFRSEQQETVSLQIGEWQTNILHDVVVNKIDVFCRVIEKSSVWEKLTSKKREVEISVSAHADIPAGTLEYTYSGGAYAIVDEIRGRWSISLTEPVKSNVRVRLADPQKTAALYKIKGN